MLAMAGITGRPGTEDDQSDGRSPGRRGELHDRAGAAGRALLGRPARADGPQRPRPSRLHPRADRLRPRATASRPTPATAPTAGRRPTPTTSACSTAWRWRRPPPARRFHGVGDTGIPRKVIAETIAGRLGVETRSITDEEAPQYLGFLAGFAGLDNPTSNDKTREVLGWEPTHPGWVEDVRDRPLLRLQDQRPLDHVAQDRRPPARARGRRRARRGRPPSARGRAPAGAASRAPCPARRRSRRRRPRSTGGTARRSARRRRRRAPAACGCGSR